MPVADRGTKVRWRPRLALALGGGLLVAWATLRAYRVAPGHHDFDQIWFASRAIIRGENPYHVIGPGLDFNWPWPFLYPLTAAIVTLPLGSLPESWAAASFMLIGGGVFAWTLMEHGYAPLAGFCSGALLGAASGGQWAPLLVSALVIPPIGIFFAAKPTVAAACFVARPSWWPVGGGIALVALALALQPTWISDWRQAMEWNNALWASSTHFRAIVTVPGGMVAMLCLLRWRRPEARLVAALACVPLTPSPYETVPLFLVPRSAGEAALLSAASFAVQFLLDHVTPTLPSDRAKFEYVVRLLAWVMYPLATAMVLRRRNEGAVPMWLEKRIALWPAWLRGTPDSVAAYAAASADTTSIHAANASDSQVS
jgi:hypothetical protein